MYLDDALNNFLDTLQPTPDILKNNPSLEQGKFVNDRSRYYAGKNVTVSTDGSIDGSCRTTTLTVQKPDLDLIERSSGPEYGTVMEGFNCGSAVAIQEGLGVATAATAAESLKTYKKLLSEYTTKHDEYTAALKAFNDGGKYAQSQYFGKFVKVVKTAAVPPKAATYDVYYVNKYGYLYKIPTGITTTPSPPELGTITEISVPTLAGFRKPTTLSADKYVAVAGQALNLAGTIIGIKNAPSSRGTTTTYTWVDIEGVVRPFHGEILSDSHRNCHASCIAKIPNALSTIEEARAAIGEKMFNTAPIVSSSFVCSELPTNVIELRDEVAALEKQLNIAASNLDDTDYSHAQTESRSRSRGDRGSSHWWNPQPQPLSSGASAPSSGSSASSGSGSGSSSSSSGAINLHEYDTLQQNMVTYDGKVGDSSLNVKSKLGYYILWVSLMLFIVVVTFRNIANSESTESGSFMISVALLILLLIYLFNYLSDLRIGPRQMLLKTVGALPEKVSGMMKFTFT